MEPVKLKLESGNDALAVVFVEDKSITLSDLRKQVMDEVEELVPEKFKFVNSWGAPVSAFQEKTHTVRDALNSNDFLIIRSFSSKVTPAEGSDDSDHETEAERQQKRKRAGTEGPAESHRKIPKPAHSVQKPGQKRVQSTLTKFLGAKPSPAARYASASARKGVHIYSEKEIVSASGMEKERRMWWNEKAKELCEDAKYQHFQRDELDKRLHEEWRLHKAQEMKKEESETAAKLEDIWKKYPELRTTCEKRTKKETITRNVIRVDQAREKVKESRAKLDEIYMGLRNTSQANPKQQELKGKLDDQTNIHQYNYRQLVKAEDSLRQILGVQKSLLRGLMEKAEGMAAAENDTV